MAIDHWAADEIADLAELAEEIAVVLRDAADVAERDPTKTLECELATVKHYMPDMHERVMKLGIRVKRRKSELEKAGRGAAQDQAERARKKKG